MTEEQRQKQREYNKRHYNKHKAELAVRMKQYRDNNKEKKSEYNKKYWENHKEELKEKNKRNHKIWVQKQLENVLKSHGYSLKED